MSFASFVPFTCRLPLLSPTASGPVEARRASDSARRPGGGEPDAGAVRQAGGRQHQNEALDGGDLCAFNRQRQAVVQVEVTSLSLSFPSLLLTVAKVKWCGLEQGNGSQGAAFCCLLTFFCFFHTMPTSCTFPPYSVSKRVSIKPAWLMHFDAVSEWSENSRLEAHDWFSGAWLLCQFGSLLPNSNSSVFFIFFASRKQKKQLLTFMTTLYPNTLHVIVSRNCVCTTAGFVAVSCVSTLLLCVF